MNYPKADISKEDAINLWISNKTDYAKEQLLLSNKGLVFHYLKRIGQLQNEDLFQIGMIGLLKAINTFDNTKNVAFSTYASTCIKNEILQTLRKNKLAIVSFEEWMNLDNQFEEKSICKADFLFLLKSLSERERKILIMRFSGCSQENIGNVLGISQARVSRILKVIKRKGKVCLI